VNVKPLSELDARGVRGILCDIDDTLTHDGALVPAAYEAIVAAKRAGLRVLPVTGRPAGWAEVLAAMWPVDAVVAENGAVAVLRDGRHLDHLWWDDEAARASQRLRLDAIIADVLAQVPRARLAEDNWLRRCDAAFDVGETQTLQPDEIEAIGARIRAGGARVLVSSVHAHAYFGTHDKAAMLVRVARERFGQDLDGDRARWIFIGDSPNDQAGFSWFPLSVGVANVTRYTARLQPPPVFVTPSEGGHGFAEMVTHVLRQQLPNR
jgi:HAD superfamily hydrolase (TIGR01484 family)